MPPPEDALLVPAHAEGLRRNNFDAIRLAMALLVVWSHAFAIWRGSEESEPLSRLMGGTYNSGNVAVLGFFAISGFLITLSYLRTPSWRDFLQKRVARIYPGYLVAVLLCSLLIVPVFSTRGFGEVTWAEAAGLASNLLLRNYILPSDAFDGGPVNGSLWSIPFEFWCYLGVLALGLAGMLRRQWTFLLLALAVMAVRVWLDLTLRRPGGGTLGWIIGFPYFWFNVLPPFLLGGAVFVLRRSIPRSAWLLAGLVLTTLACANAPIADPLRTALTRVVFPPTLVYALFYVAFSRRLHAPNAARYGDFSYGSYLYAFPIEQMLAWTLRDRIGFPAYIALAMVLTIVAGAASWFLVERWFLRRPGKRRPSAPLQEESEIVAP